MNVATRGMRNAFRNATRTISIVVILGLSIGLSLVMLIAHQAVNNKIETTLSSIGNTVRIQPAGYSGGSAVTTALTDAQLNKVKKVPHVKTVAGMLNASLQPKGTTGNPVPLNNDPTSSQSSSTLPTDDTATTSLKMPSKLDCTKGSCTSGNTGLSSSGGEAPKLPDNFSLPVTVAGTNTRLDPAVISASKLDIVAGKPIDGTKDADVAMVSKAIADKTNLKVGSTFTAYNRKLKVAAIFNSDTQAGNSNIIVSLPALQRYTKQTGLITNAVATVDSLEHLTSATRTIQNTLGSAADVTSPLDEANKALEPLRSVQNVSLYSLIGAVVAGAIIILLTMIMIVRERKREIGVFKAIGFSNVRIMLQFMCEALTFTTLAAVIGLGIGVVGGNPVTSTLVKNTSGSGPGIGFDGALGGVRDVQAAVGWHILLYGFGAAVLIALIGSALASFFIAKVRPAEVLRSE